MSDAIDRAALHDEVEYRLRTAAAHYRSCGKHGTDPGDFLDREIEAMTERLAGLIAPAPLREEWTVIYVDPPYGTSIPMDELHARSLATRNDTLTRRYVTDPEVVR